MKKYLVKVIENKYHTELCSFEFDPSELSYCVFFAIQMIKRVNSDCSIFLDKVQEDEK